MENQNQDQAAVAANPREKVVKFFFRQPTEAMKKFNAEEGLPEPIKRAEVEVTVPVLTASDILAILNGTDAKAIDLVVDQVNQVLVDEVRSQVDDLPTYEEVDVSKLDFSTVDFVKLANTERATRSGGGISEETWADFEADFVEVLITKTSTEEATAKKVVTILTKRLKDVSTKEVVLQKLGDYLDTWFTQTTEAQQVALASVYERLNKRIEGYKATVNDDPLAALGI